MIPGFLNEDSSERLRYCYIISVVKHTIIDFSSQLCIFGSKVVKYATLAPLAPNIPYGKYV